MKKHLKLNGKPKPRRDRLAEERYRVDLAALSILIRMYPEKAREFLERIDPPGVFTITVKNTLAKPQDIG